MSIDKAAALVVPSRHGQGLVTEEQASGYRGSENIDKLATVFQPRMQLPQQVLNLARIAGEFFLGWYCVLRLLIISFGIKAPRGLVF